MHFVALLMTYTYICIIFLRKGYFLFLFLSHFQTDKMAFILSNDKSKSSTNAQVKYWAICDNLQMLETIHVGDSELETMAGLFARYRGTNYSEEEKREVNKITTKLKKTPEDLRWRLLKQTLQKCPFFVHVIWKFLLNILNENDEILCKTLCSSFDQYSVKLIEAEKPEMFDKLKMNLHKRKKIIACTFLEMIEQQDLRHDIMMLNGNQVKRETFTMKIGKHVVHNKEDIELLIELLDFEIEKKKKELDKLRKASSESKEQIEALEEDIRDLQKRNQILRSQLSKTAKHLEKKEDEISEVSKLLKIQSERNSRMEEILAKILHTQHCQQGEITAIKDHLFACTPVRPCSQASTASSVSLPAPVDESGASGGV